MKKVHEQPPAEKVGVTSEGRNGAGTKKAYEKPSARKVSFSALLATRM